MTQASDRVIRKPLYLSFFLALLLIAAMATAPAYGAGQKEEMLSAQALIGALQQGGYVIYLRHAATDKTQKKATSPDFADCATQRNLSEHGREQARTIGKAVERLGINVADVISSPYCRCLDTAKLAFGRASSTDDLVFTMGLEKSETDRKTEALRRMLATPPQPKTNTVIVAHSANLKEAAKVWPKPEGVAHVFKPMGEGGFQHMGRILPGDWENLTAGR